MYRIIKLFSLLGFVMFLFGTLHSLANLVLYNEIGTLFKFEEIYSKDYNYKESVKEKERLIVDGFYVVNNKTYKIHTSVKKDVFLNDILFSNKIKITYNTSFPGTSYLIDNKFYKFHYFTGCLYFFMACFYMYILTRVDVNKWVDKYKNAFS